jgi:creatinine amidohydrolase
MRPGFSLPCFLAELHYPAAEALRAEKPVVFVPVGATEAHGPHLPLGTDVLLSESLARRAQKELWQRGVRSLIAPSLAYAVTEFGSPFAGTVSLDAATATALYTGVCLGILRSGFFRVCLINSHLEPAHVSSLHAAVLEIERRSGLRVAFPDHTERRWARTLTDEYKSGNCHAGRYETALLLSTRPELVDEAERRTLAPNDPDFLGAMRSGVTDFAAAGGPRAYFGDPAAATAAEGEDIYARLVHMVLAVLEETWPGSVAAES